MIREIKEGDFSLSLPFGGWGSFVNKYSDYDNIKFCLCVGTCLSILSDSGCNSVAFPFRFALVNILNKNLCACEGEY